MGSSLRELLLWFRLPVDAAKSPRAIRTDDAEVFGYYRAVARAPGDFRRYLARAGKVKDTEATAISADRVRTQ